MAFRWYCMQIQAQLQETAAYHLKRQNFRSFFPSIERARRLKAITVEPMFKGYGFVKIDVAVDRWLSVNGTRGVIGLLPRLSLTPEPMPEGFVEHLLRNDPLKEVDFVTMFDDYFPGLEVVVTSDHRYLAGQTGTVLAVRTKMLQIVFANSIGVWMDKGVVALTEAGVEKVEERAKDDVNR